MTTNEVILDIRASIKYLGQQKGDFSVAYNYGYCRGQISSAFMLRHIDADTYKMLSDEAEEIYKKID